MQSCYASYFVSNSYAECFTLRSRPELFDRIKSSLKVLIDALPSKEVILCALCSSSSTLRMPSCVVVRRMRTTDQEKNDQMDITVLYSYLVSMNN